jgi:phospholipid/cholesterol/gamma-HCH transport system substrate-binding protein
VINKDLIDLKAYFQNTSGLSLGDPVTVSGVRKGKVKEINLIGDSVMVLFNLERGIKIRKDYKLEVAIAELMGGKQLAISPGRSNEEIDYESTLSGTTSGDISEIIRNVNGLSSEVKNLIKGFGNTNENILKALGNLNDIIGDKNMQKNLKSTLSNFEVTSRNLNLLVRDNTVSLKSITDKAGTALDNVNSLIDENSPEFKKTFQQIQVLTAKVDSLVTSINVITTDIQMRRSGIGKFIYDDKFFDNLNKTLEEIEKLTKKIRQDGLKINLF